MQLAPARIEALEQQMIPYLCQLEQGTETTPEALLRDCHSRQVLEMRQLAVDSQPLPASSLPSLTSFETALRSTKAGKATGLDPVPSGLHHAHSPTIAKLYYSLLLKMHLWCVEPLQFKGGIMTMIPKKGSPTCASSYRGILLLATVAKRMHSLLRSSLMNTLSPKKVEGQLGGFPKQMVQFGFHAVSSWTRSLEQQGHSTAVIYLDLASAFHHLIRETVLGISKQADYDHLVDELRRTGHPLQAQETGQKIIGALEAIGCDPRLLYLLRDVHTDTWFTVTSKEIVRTTRGTRPGSPLADSVFHVIMTHVITEVRQWLCNREDFQALLGSLGLPTLSIVWADDVAIPLATERASELLPFVHALVKFIDGRFTQQGFTINYDLNKTNVVISFQGQDAPALRRQYLLHERPGMTCELGPDRKVWLHFKPHYKHLGFTYAATQTLEVEIRQRIGQAQQAMTQLSRPILANRHIPEHLRVRLFNVFIATRLFYGLGTWRTPSLQNMKALSTTYVALLKRVLRVRHDARLTNGQVFQKAATLDIRQQLALDRLRYARKLFCDGPEFLQNLVHLEFQHCSDSWLHGLIADIQWLKVLVPHRVPDLQGNDITAFVDLWQLPSTPWKRILKQAWKTALLQEHMMVDIQVLHGRIFAVLKDGGAEFAFYDLYKVLPRTDCLDRIEFLKQKHARLQAEEAAPSRPHRPVRTGTANPGERRRTIQQVPSCYDAQADWLAAIRKMQWRVLPEDPTMPIYRSLQGRPHFLIVHIFLEGAGKAMCIAVWRGGPRLATLTSPCCRWTLRSP